MRLLPILLLGAAACGDSGDVGGRPGGGTLGNQTKPECGALNQICLSIGLDAPLAQGAYTELILDFDLVGSTGQTVGLEVVDTSVLTLDETELHASGAGMSALLFVDEQDRVLDFLHVNVAVADELRIIAYSRNGDLLGPVLDHVTLLPGDEVLVSVEPFRVAQPLLGTFVLNREIEGDADAVIMVPDAVGGLYRVVAREPGDATITVQALGITRTWEIEVLP